MTQKSDTHVFTGLQQDISISKLSPEHLIDAHNIRITAKLGETLFSLTNEKGPLLLNMVDVYGNAFNIEDTETIVGYAILNEYLVLFVKSDTDYIVRINMESNPPVAKVLFSGILNFNVDYPLETVVDYENEDIQKVYWTDGLNQPRLINIMKEDYSWEGSFDFNPTLQLKETVLVTKLSNSSGNFAPGVIQYAFTYYNKYAQETSIFYTTPLNYISYYDRGASPEDTVSNAFKIIVNNLDTHFEYLRIYSIHRTSLNGTPICKRVLDLKIGEDDSITFIDTGNEGDTIASTDLLYKGGEEVQAKSMCAKDGTMFLGNLKLSRKSIRGIEGLKDLSESLVPQTYLVKCPGKVVSSDASYPYVCGLNTLAAGFKNREYYRLGYQAQYKDGTWSDPIWITDYQVLSDKLGLLDLNKYKNGWVEKLTIELTVGTDIQNKLLDNGYKKIRPLVVFPELQDRTVLCQGIGNPTMSTNTNENAGLNALSSWFWRPLMKNVLGEDSYASSAFYTDTTCSPFSVPVKTRLPYCSNLGSYNPKIMRAVEIEGVYNYDDLFWINWNIMTLHSPELEFDDAYKTLDFSGTGIRVVGYANFYNTYSAIDVTTSTPCISELGTGFVKKTFNISKSLGIVGGLFWDDFVVDDLSDEESWFTPFDYEQSAVKYLLYPWHAQGSLNNDINRKPDGGQRTAVLEKKVMSNLRNTLSNFFKNSIVTGDISSTSKYRPQVFDSLEVTAIKLSNLVYEGNIDTLLTPNDYDGTYFCFNGDTLVEEVTETPFNSTTWWKTFATKTASEGFTNHGLYKWISDDSSWTRKVTEVGDAYKTLVVKKEPVRMKYKTTPHLVFYNNGYEFPAYNTDYPTLPILEVYREYDSSTMFGGQTEDAFKANTWLPAGNAYTLSNLDDLVMDYVYGDTWYSRYDHLKTYPYTDKDINQIVEIGSFELESRLNLDGRYDRNRNQVSNLNITPENFNKFNSVYSQRDNYFSYKILDEDYYNIDEYPTEITWSLLKSAGNTIDPWTTTTLASTFDLDGTYGSLNAIVNWSNALYCFQDTNISNLLFNSRVQIPTSDGTPIEITNNYKVDGKRDFLNNVGCKNKYSICRTPMSLYFIDSVSSHLMSISSKGFNDVSLSLNMHTWYNNLDNTPWKPLDYSTKVFYDGKSKDLYTITKDEALIYNEVFGLFISFFSYDAVDFMFNVTDLYYCIKDNKIYHMFEGRYNDFFGQDKPYDITFISNGKGSNLDLSTLDKTFSTIDFRCDVFKDELNGTLLDDFAFDTSRVWDEYQDTGDVSLSFVQDLVSNLKKKFRSWHFTIPRDKANGRDRIRNNWCKIKFSHTGSDNNAMILHDTEVQYFV